jgi:glycine hydroxymethyltransferase
MKGNIRKMSSILDGAVFPGTQGGPLEHVIAAKAVAFGEALTDEFGVYAKNVIANSKALAKSLVDHGYKIISGGTDNHMMLIDLRAKDENLTGKMADDILVRCHITINKNTVPFETRSPFVTSGIRIGASAITSRGMGVNEMPQIVELIDYALMNRDDDAKLKSVTEKVHSLMKGFPLY